MRKILTLILLLLPLIATPQSKQSNLLYQKGVQLFDAEKYEEALPYLMQSDSLDKAKLKPKSPNYHRAALKIADCNEKLAEKANDQGNYAEAIRLETLTMETRKNVLGEQHLLYATAANDLAEYYKQIANYPEAIRLINIALEIRKAKLGEEHHDYAESLEKLANNYSLIGNFAEAIRLGNIVTETLKKASGEDDYDYAKSLSALASFYSRGDNFTEAVKYGTIAVEKIRKKVGEEHPEYISALHNLASYNSDINNLKEAIRLEQIVMEYRKKTDGEEHISYAISLHQLAMLKYKIKNVTEAIELETKAIEIIKKTFGEENPNYAVSLCNLALYYNGIEKFDDAISVEKKALAIVKKNFGEEHPFYATLVENHAVTNFKADHFDEAIKYGNLALELKKKIWGEHHQQYNTSLLVLSEVYFYDKNFEKSSYYHQQTFTRTQNYILQNFASMSYNDRIGFWKIFSNFYNYKIPFFAYKLSAEPTYKDVYAALAYDGLVLSKGLLLNTEVEIQKIIEQSSDTIFANRYQKIKANRDLLDQLNQLPIAARPMDADSLSMAIEQEERLLVESSKALGDYTKNISISWRDIQKNLKDNDLAIEFAMIKDPEAKQIIYAAFVLKKGMESPSLVKLYDTDTFWDIKPQEYYTTPKLYNLIWQPLAQYLKGVKNVYFAPSGQLHTIAVEYLSDDKGKIFAEKYDTYRLSSTRELALERTINPNRKASTYGGIQYEFSEDEWQNLKNEDDSTRQQFRDIPQIADNLRGDGVGMGYLEGTKWESETIATLLRSANYDVSALSDAAATEESFKNLSGSGIKILHIGTHGFYENEGIIKNAGYSFYASESQNDEDKSLSCSGLLFAGANSTLDPNRTSEIPEGADDGVLTAKEISRLDFNGLDLVVLSACQTGLGEITDEGVFGLQRGFKKAGAQTIIMSLWKVADESTQLLMVEFFKNLTAGQSKRAAFIAAQKTVRTKFPNPLYWAAFVMIDGM